MSLKFVLGGSGSGKSEYIIDSAVKTEALGKNAIIIVPEQYTHQCEQAMLKKTGYICESLYVTSFNRLASRLISESGLYYKRADSCAKAMMVTRALTKCRQKLTYFKNAENHTGYIELFADSISEFKKGQIMPETLQVMSQEVENPVFSAKLSDIAQIYEEYNKLLGVDFCDGDDDITLMASLCFGNEYIKNSVIYIDEFYRFTKNELFCIEAMLSSGADVVVSLCMPENENASNNFSVVKATKKQLEYCAKSAGVSLAFPVVMSTQHRFISPELLCLERSMAEGTGAYNGQVQDVDLAVFKNRYDEAEYVATQIKKLVKDGYSYRDIAVITGDYEGYKELICTTFSLYDIPVFADNRKKFLDHPVVVYLFSVLDLLGGFTTDKVCAYMKSGFADITSREASRLENYALSCAINYNDWQNDERFLKKSASIFAREEDSGQEGQEHLKVKNRLIAPILNLKEKISASKNVADRVDALCSFLEETQLKEKIIKIAEDFRAQGKHNLSDEYTEVYNIIIETLDTMKSFLGDENAGLGVISEILRSGFSQRSIGIIPKVYDSIAFGDLNRSVIKNVRAVFLIGVNDGMFPSIPDSGLILSDEEREFLISRGVSVAPDSKTLISGAEFSVYETVNIAREKLFVSYPIDNDGQGMRPAGFVSKLKRTFPELKQKSYLTEEQLPPEVSVASKASAFNYVLTNLSNKNPLADKLFDYLSEDEEYKEKLKRAVAFSKYENKAGKLSKDAVSALYGKSLVGSVSRFERFSACPFSFFVEYGLRARERKVLKVEAPDVGSLLHEVVEIFGKQVHEQGLSFGVLTKSQQTEMTDKIIEEMFAGMMVRKVFAQGRVDALKKRLKSLVSKSVWAICEHVARGEFEPAAFELSFDKNGDIEPVTVTLPTGEEITMIGRIDRVDTFSDEGKLYIKVIDYKTGHKKYSLADIFNKTTLQLSVYMMAVTENGKKVFGSDDTAFGGMFYFKLDDPVEEGEPDTGRDEEKALKAFKMSGLVADSQQVINAMDKGVSGWSAVIPVYMKADGTPSASQSKLANPDRYEKLKRHVTKAVTEIGQEILSGNIDISPVRNGDITPCSYCRYRMVCGFDINEHPCRYAEKFSSDDDIWNEMK